MIGRADRGRPIGAVVVVAWLSASPWSSHHAVASETTSTDQAGFLAWALGRADAELEAASAALEPPLVAPVAIKVKWKPRRIASIDLGAPLLAITAADVDRDGRAELVALTTGEVVVIEAGRKPAVAARAVLPPVAASLRPRDPVGAVVVGAVGAGVEVLARSSEQAAGGIYGWRDGALVELARLPGFPLGQGARGELAPGKNYFTASSVVYPAGLEPATPPAHFYAALHRDGMVDPAGRPLAASGFVASDGRFHLHLRVTCRPAHAPCPEPAPPLPPLPHAGVAAAIADVDNDGFPELVVAADRAPGDPDQVTVVTAREGRFEPVYSHNFNGGVAGLVVVDLDGDRELDVLAAVRLLGSTRIDLWILND